MKEKMSYDKEVLKIDQQTAQKVAEQAKEEVYEEEKKQMSNIKAAFIVLLLIVMYAIVSAIPTFLMMYFLDVNFWLSQLIVIIGMVIASFAFGLHKPASNELKLKSKYLL